MSDVAPAKRQRRADAERSVAAILEAAMTLLADRPEASMSEIAAAAGVTRQTVYAHFGSREALLGVAAERALGETLAAFDAADPESGSAAAALDRLIDAWWRSVSRHARLLEALAAAYPTASAIHELHAPIVERLEALARRGQGTGEFDARLPDDWLAASFLALMHASADAVAAGRIEAVAAGEALAITIPRAFGVVSQ